MKVTRRQFLIGGTACTIIPVLNVTAEDESSRNFAMVYDQSKCIGCERCEQACRETNDIPASYSRLEIIRTGPFGEGEDRHYRFDRSSCVHCETAPCISVCPTGAPYRDKDGIVAIHQERCVGCKYCVAACPSKVRHLNPVTKVIDKCDFCRTSKLAKGELPACVEVCPTKALVFGDLNDHNSEIVQLLRHKQTFRDKMYLGTRPKLYKIPHGRGEVI
ncbi:4Fe-4S dicluster domain-containing protein [Ferrimonas lipolytica]|uniref:4Fe-4S dicluster domain-containing protein n=1 Tax=Ferrimonas lipolytica TaxID=2724191 RepID=A0A6H1UEJ6_9GAMM|nr:4Fe-4S dicluster domain-containing protein [Ferrimonas lipolytica]QIZ77527.1 4Fe-4S dicluster domain-containing protein [Ferrimonas lipolytica]